MRTELRFFWLLHRAGEEMKNTRLCIWIPRLASQGGGYWALAAVPGSNWNASHWRSLYRARGCCTAWVKQAKAGANRNMVRRLVRQVQCPFEKEFGEILQRLDRHSKVVDKTAVAVEMLKASEYREKQEHAAQVALKLQIESWMKAANMRVVYEAQLKNKLHGTCEWIWNNTVFSEWVQLSSQTPSDRLLVVHGTHGCGKSTLASAIVSRYRAQARRCLFFAFSGSVDCR